MVKVTFHFLQCGDWAETLDGQDFVLANDGQDDKIVLSGTESSLKLLSEANTYYVDGTFCFTPSIFYQLFTIHIVKHNQSFSLVYALLPSKQRQTYSHAFLLLKSWFQNGWSYLSWSCKKLISSELITHQLISSKVDLVNQGSMEDSDEKEPMPLLWW